MLKFPLEVWGTVAATPEAGKVAKIKVVRSPGGGFLILTQEGGRVYDTWVESSEDVESDLGALQIEWPIEA